VFEGKDVSHAVADRPIAFIHQDLGLIEWLTVAENVCLTRRFAKRGGLNSWKASRHRAAEVFAKLGISIDPDLRVKQLGPTERSLVAIARALTTVMDEPTASLPADEVARLFAAIRVQEHLGSSRRDPGLREGRRDQHGTERERAIAGDPVCGPYPFG
jgi:ribose transport system ATP-binding protein